MNTTEPEDDLIREYRNASAEDAGAPGKATRDAILAEARKAALRRRPAANDPRYILRAVAGVAVIGVAVMLWRQQDPRMPMLAQPTVVTAAAKSEAPSADPAASVSAPEPARESLSVPSPPSAVAQRAADNAAVADSEAFSNRSEAPAALAEDRAREILPPAAPAMRSTAAGQSTAAQSATEDGSAMLRRAFSPALQNAITPPDSAWVITDAAGVVLRSGVVTAPADLAAIAASAERDFAGQRVSPWRQLPATTSAGTAIDVHIAELQIREQD